MHGGAPNQESSEAHHESGTRGTILLDGCSPTPLAHYLKALAVLRLVSQQTSARRVAGRWDHRAFVLETSLSREELLEFFLRDYEPTPIVSPWNGGSGIKPAKPKSDVVAIRDSDAERLEPIRTTVRQAFDLMDRFGFQKKVPSKQKTDFLEACRSTFPDRALEWLDAAFVLTRDDPKYPPILGTGGNDGRLDFSINFLSRIADLFDLDTGEPTPLCRAWLEASLFEAVESHLDSGAIGQFFPQAAGGANGETGYSSDTVANPWDFVLMLEGAVMFASATVKKLESSTRGALSAPFCVRHVGVGHGSTDVSEEGDARPEMWLPLWDRPASSDEVHALLSEGRVRVGRRAARDGLDFVRAIGSLGVDRGITAFQRYGFQMRNGRAYFATPLNRIPVQRRPEVDLINDIDGWLDRFRSATRGDSVPGSLKSVSRQLQSAVFQLCEFGHRSHVEAVLIALGKCERAMAKSHRWAIDSFVRPVSGLSERWLDEADDGSAEFRMGAALASVYGWYSSEKKPDSLLPIRAHLEPVRTVRRRRAAWRQESSPDVVWQSGDPIDALNRILARRLVHASQAHLDVWPDRGVFHVSLEDIAHFIDGRLDVRRIIDLAWGLIGIKWPAVDPRYPRVHGSARPGALFSLMKLCYVHDLPEIQSVPIEPRIHRYAAAGDGHRASRAAAQRLRGSGVVPHVDSIPLKGERVKRAASALLFPLRATRELIDSTATLPDDESS